MVVRPKQKQPETIRALDLDITKLEDVARFSLEGWLNDQEQSEGIPKKAVLREIFEVAKAEERFQRGATASSDIQLERRDGMAKGSDRMPGGGKKHEDLGFSIHEPLIGD